MSRVSFPPPVSTNPAREEDLSRDADWHAGPMQSYRVVARLEAYVPETPLKQHRRGEHSDPRKAPRTRLSTEARKQIAVELAAVPTSIRGSALLQRIAVRYDTSRSTVFTIAQQVLAAEEGKVAAAGGAAA